MEGLDLIKTFREVAAKKSFSRAALSLELSKATVSKHIAELERRSGIRLLNRTTRSLSLTDAGMLLLEKSAALVSLAEHTLAELQGRARRPAGRLRVTAPHGLMNGWLPPLMASYIEQYPDVYVSLRLSNRVIDLVKEGVDVALQLGRVEDESLIARRLLPMDLAICATSAYWAKHGVPRHPDDLRNHPFLTYSLMPDGARLPFEVDGKPYFVPVQSRMEASDAMPLIELALRGLGVIYVPTFMIKPQLESGALVQVLRSHMPRDLWVFAVYAQRQFNSAALRSFIDFLAAGVTDPAS
jgi:DNA-binding transcriptional LysR family regulator